MVEAWEELAERMHNFYYSDDFTKNIDNIIVDGKKQFKKLHRIKKHIKSTTKKISDTSDFKEKCELVSSVFSLFYKWFVESNKLEEIMFSDEELTELLFQPFVFLTLCHFLNRSKKCKSESMSDFLQKNSPLVKEGIERREKNDKKMTINEIKDTIDRESVTIRKYKNRLFKQRPVYYNREAWHSMPLSSESEWSMFYSDIKFNDTFKRIGNLYNEFYLEKYSKMPIEEKYNKFQNKLSKISLQNYVELSQDIVEQILADKSHIGLNLFRFEKEMSFKNLQIEINALLQRSDEERSKLIRIFYHLNDIVFPHIKTFLFSLFLTNEKYAWIFLYFFNILKTGALNQCLLILDDLVDNEYFGNEWEELFREITNELAEYVLYDPEDVHYEFNTQSEKAFKDILSGLVKIQFNIN